MKRLCITLFILLLYAAFICRPLALIPPLCRMLVFLILLVIQSMNTALQLTRPYSGKFFLKLVTGILNILVLCLGILFAFMIFIVF